MPRDIYIVEDHPIVREGYASLIEGQMDLEVFGATDSAAVAREEISEGNPDLAIVDLSLEEGNGLELVKDLEAQGVEVPVLVVSMHDESLYAERVLEAGADGYLSKNSSSENVVDAIRTILDGKVYFSEDVKEEMLQRYLGTDMSGSKSRLHQLSDRELQVFEYMGRGLTTQQIAEELNLSPKTIGTYRTRAKEKLGLDSNAELRRQAVVWLAQDES